MDTSDRQDQPADALVLFGLTGDLGKAKLFPALYDLARSGRLDMPVIGVGRSDYSDEDLSEMFVESLREHVPASDLDHDVADSVDLRYLSGDSADADTYRALAQQLNDRQLPVIYAAVPPHLFGDIASRIAGSELPPATRLVVEKPFGHGVRSATELWESITDALSAERVFLVDHFLAKAAVENMSTVRHCNPLISNSLDADGVESIDVKMLEKDGVEGRGSFYEGVGVIDDVVQNHLMQTLAIVTMEAPGGSTAQAFHDARAQLLRDVRTVSHDDVILGQYRGYRELEGVDDDSDVPTFASLELCIDNDRWAGVPIRLVAGKALADDCTSVTFNLRETAPSVGVPNRITFEVKPRPSVSFDIAVLDPETHEPRSTIVYACGPDDHGALSDYAVMFDNALQGESRHFAQIDGVVEAWRILDDLQDAPNPILEYAVGSDGPTGNEAER